MDGRDESGGAARATTSHLANVLVALDDRGVAATATKRLLPNYEVFDELRYFQARRRSADHRQRRRGRGGPVDLRGRVDPRSDPAAELVAQGATLLVVANASPYARGRREEREVMLRERALETGCPIAYVNLVGGQDELVFDGQSVVVDADGDVIARAVAFREELLVVDVDARGARRRRRSSTPSTRATSERSLAHLVNHVAEPLDEVEEIYEALVMGTRDYLRKNGFRSAMLGLSGGVDSSLVATIAVDAVGVARGARASRCRAATPRTGLDRRRARAWSAPRHRGRRRCRSRTAHRRVLRDAGRRRWRRARRG